jgi:hypothetical protein
MHWSLSSGGSRSRYLQGHAPWQTWKEIFSQFVVSVGLRTVLQLHDSNLAFVVTWHSPYVSLTLHGHLLSRAPFLIMEVCTGLPNKFTIWGTGWQDCNISFLGMKGKGQFNLWQSETGSRNMKGLTQSHRGISGQSKTRIWTSDPITNWWITFPL